MLTLPLRIFFWQRHPEYFRSRLFACSLRCQMCGARILLVSTSTPPPVGPTRPSLIILPRSAPSADLPPTTITYLAHFVALLADIQQVRAAYYRNGSLNTSYMGGLSSGARLEPLRELHCSASRRVVCRVLLVADKVAVAFAFPKLHCAAGRGQQRALSSLSSRLDGAPKLQSSRSGVMDWCYYARHPASRQTTWRKWCEQ